MGNQQKRAVGLPSTETLPLDEREKVFFGGSPKGSYSGRLFRIASELNARVIEGEHPVTFPVAR
jgi:hypothetical protein